MDGLKPGEAELLIALCISASMTLMVCFILCFFFALINSDNPTMRPVRRAPSSHRSERRNKLETARSHRDGSTTNTENDVDLVP